MILVPSAGGRQRRPSASAGADVNGTRYWMIAYERDFSTDNDIGLAAMQGATMLETTTLPALERGFTRAGDGRSRRDFEISCQALLITGYTEEEMKQSEAGTKMQIAFYGSTPAYRCVLDTHGWGDLQGELNRLSKEGRWMEMAALIDEPMLDALTVRCAPKDVPARLAARYAGLVDRLSLVCHSRPEANHPGEWSDVVAAIRGIEAGPAPRP